MKANSIIKKYPPYGRILDDLRRKGLVPVHRIVVSTDWKLGAAFPRIVIPADAKIDQLIFAYLAGLSVQIVHHNGQEKIVKALVQKILDINPKVLTVFNFDIAQENDQRYSASTLIHPAWEVINGF
ncbi:hypothetical protein SAMN06296273_0706 [Nitrosomonas ureae]|uniref:Uncharacterized protein n=1 Tax=Nitrosomonas ureae TaxID=44577 RepID=A0A285BWH3_9PROT|nr:hypothetical protein [Nitrosomonas ureae]SNX59266.1 hypothetical protein SAMN06296273_0706 [Nitrosomonas ureae]